MFIELIRMIDNKVIYLNINSIESIEKIKFDDPDNTMGTMITHMGGVGNTKVKEKYHIIKDRITTLTLKKSWN